MKDVVYLVCNQQKVVRMTKNLPDLYRGEIPVKLTVTVPKEAFGTPTLDQEIYVEDWRKGIDLEDVEFKHNIITQEEAETIRQRRLERMQEILEAQGYEVTKPESE